MHGINKVLSLALVFHSQKLSISVLKENIASDKDYSVSLLRKKILKLNILSKFITFSDKTK